MIDLMSVARRAHGRRAVVGVGTAIAIAALMAVTPTMVCAKALVQGNPDAVSIEAQNTSIKEILAALGKSFNLRYQSSANLETQISGTYQGSLPQVVKRILEGYNFILKSNNGTIEISVLGQRNAPVVAGATPTKTAPQASPAAQPSPTQAAKPNNDVAERPVVAQGTADTTNHPVVAEHPAAAAAPPVSRDSSDAPVPIIKVAEGPTPPLPMPTTDAGSGPVPEVRTSTAVMPPMPTPGATPLPGPEPKPSTVEPPAFQKSTTPATGVTPAVPKQ